jgi:hypothetical protein
MWNKPLLNSHSTWANRQERQVAVVFSHSVEEREQCLTRRDLTKQTERATLHLAKDGVGVKYPPMTNRA